VELWIARINRQESSQVAQRWAQFALLCGSSIVYVATSNKEKVQYIDLNPVKAGLVNRA
jgi:hypothetical protein